MAHDWNESLEHLRTSIAQIEQAQTDLEKLHDRATAEVAKYLRMDAGVEVDVDAIKALVTRPYTLLPINEHEAWLIQARGVRMPMVGWLVAQEPAFNKFRVSRSMDLVTPLPAWMKHELGWKPPEHKALIDGTRTSLRITQGDEGAFKRRYGKQLGPKQADGSYKIRGGDAWIKLVAQLVRDGILPYAPQPVAPEHWDATATSPITLREYQVPAVQAFREKGAVLINFPPGAGKTYIALDILNHFRGRVLLLADTVILTEQWKDRIKQFAPQADVTISTYQGASKYLDREWDLLIPDEAQRLPANTFSKLAFAKAKYRLGLTGTPWREDDRQHLIVALAGFPVAVRWAELLKSGVLRRPRIVVATVPSDSAKTAYVKSLLSRNKGRAIVFCDWIEQGQALADALDVPFIHGETRNKLQRLEEAEVAVVSRIGDRGLDLPDLQLVVEVAFAGSAREQFAQRVGRLLHGHFEGEFHTVFTPEEAAKFRPRIFGVEAELAGEVDIEFVNVGNIAEKSTAVHVRPSRSRPVRGTHAAATGEPQSELDMALANPAVRKLIDQAEAKIGVKAGGYVQKAVAVCWNSPVTFEELRAGKALGEEGMKRYRAGIRGAQKVGLIVDVGGGRYLTDRAKIKKLMELSERFRK